MGLVSTCAPWLRSNRRGADSDGHNFWEDELRGPVLKCSSQLCVAAPVYMCPCVYAGRTLAVFPTGYTTRARSLASRHHGNQYEAVLNAPLCSALVSHMYPVCARDGCFHSVLKHAVIITFSRAAHIMHARIASRLRGPYYTASTALAVGADRRVLGGPFPVGW